MAYDLALPVAMARAVHAESFKLCTSRIVPPGELSLCGIVFSAG